MDHHADLPSTSYDHLDPLDANRLLFMNIVEWLDDENIQKKIMKEEVTSWLRGFDPDKDLSKVRELWSRNAQRNQTFRLFMNQLRKEYSTHFSQVGDKACGYRSHLDKVQEHNEEEVLVEGDSFIYGKEERAYKKLGFKSPYKCTNCGGTDCIPFELEIDDSTTPEMLAKLFTFVELELEGKQEELKHIDVLGSGVGCISYCAFFFIPDPVKISSYEWDPEFRKIQDNVISKNEKEMGRRINVISMESNNLPLRSEELSLVLLCDRWLILLKNDKPMLSKLIDGMKFGSIIATFRSLEYWMEQGGMIGEDQIEIKRKLRLENELEESECDKYYHLYKVL